MSFSQLWQFVLYSKQMQSLYHQRTTCLHSHARLIITTYNYNRNNNSTIPYLKYIGFTCKYSAHIPPKSLHIVHGASRVAQISRNPSPSVRLVTRDINIYPRAHSFSLSFFTLSLSPFKSFSAKPVFSGEFRLLFAPLLPAVAVAQ